MTTHLANNPPMFNSIVHVDDTAVGGKRMYGCGHRDTETRWLFGIVDKTHHKCYLEFLPDKSHPSIIPIIQRHCQPGIQIHSDGAQVYKCLNCLGYNHFYVIHEHDYVNPLTGIHSNYIENLWGNFKMHLKAIRGSQHQILDGHIDEFMYRYNRKNEGKIFDLLITNIATYYPL